MTKSNPDNIDLTISADNTEIKSMDFALLRAVGIKWIQNLSGKDNVWTDYNTHDPGITILEALCYIITELGLQLQLPIEDSIASAGKSAPDQQALYIAQNIFPNSPVTEEDLRMVLIDYCEAVSGQLTRVIKNAWLNKESFYRPSVFYDDISGKPSYTTGLPVNFSGFIQCLSGV